MDPLSLLGRAVAVFLLLGVTLWLVRRTDGLKKLRRSETPLEVLGSARLGKGASVALVRIGDADYALGVTDQAVSLLTEAELGEEPQPTDAGSEPKARSGFPAALQAQLGLLTRKGHGPRAEQADATPPTPAGPAATNAADSDFEQLLAAATAPVETADDPAERGAGEGDATLSSRLKEILAAAEAAPDASSHSDPVPVPVRERPGRSTGARGARGPRARAAAEAGTSSAAAAARTGQRRSGRSRTGVDSAAA